MKPKIYMIGNTHFDPVWLWKWDEAMSSITATFRSALDRMEEYPEFKYSFATPPVFEWIKNTSPRMLEEIKRRVEYRGKAQAVKLTVEERAYTLSVEPYEIFTAVIDGERIAKVDMLEENPI